MPGHGAAATWVSACPSWALGPLLDPPQWHLRAPNSPQGPQGEQRKLTAQGHWNLSNSEPRSPPHLS